MVHEFIDEGVSGRTDKRPGLNQLIEDARKGKFKIVIVHSIDRLGRSTKHLLNLLDELSHYGVSIISMRENLDFSTPTGQMALTMISAVAQLESQIISERIKTSLAVKKNLAKKSGNGWKCGRPAISNDIKEQVYHLKDQGLSIRKIAQSIGDISKSSVERVLKERSACPKRYRKSLYLFIELSMIYQFISCYKFCTQNYLFLGHYFLSCLTLRSASLIYCLVLLLFFWKAINKTMK